MTSFSLAVARSVAAVSNFLVSSWISSFTWSRSSSVSALSFCSWSAGFVAVAADVADRDLGFLGQLVDAGHQLAAHFGRQRRHVDADQPAVVLRIEPQVAGLHRLFDVLERAGIERPNDDLRGFGRADRGDGLDRRGRAVDLDPQRIDQARIGPAGANAGQVLLELGQRLFHALFGIEQNFFDAHGIVPFQIALGHRRPRVAQAGAFHRRPMASISSRRPGC